MVATATRKAKGTPKLTAYQETLVIDNQALVRILAAILGQELPTCILFEELLAAGNLGLADAALRYDPTHRPWVSFKGFARKRVIGSIKDYLRTIDPLTRSMRQCVNLVQKVEGYGEMTTEQVAHATGETEDMVQAACEYLNETACSVAIRREHRLELSTLPGQIPEAKHRDAERIISLAFSCLKPRHRRAMELYYFDDLSMRQIGLQLHVNESRISQIIKFATDTCRDFLDHKGYNSIQQIM